MNSKDKDNNVTEECVDLEKVDKSRRFLSKAGLLMPVLITLTSRPALGRSNRQAGPTPGGVADCFTPSRSLSRNTSLSQQGKYGECSGQSPGFWQGQPDMWPISKDTLFHLTFAEGNLGNTYKNTDGTSKTMYEVVRMRGNADPEQIAFHIIGAYLNIKQGWVSAIALDETGLLGIWSEYAINGYYEPTAGVKWYPTQIKDYLLSNHIIN